MGNEIANVSELEPLTEYEPVGLALGFEYWTPEKQGESRKAYFAGLATRTIPSADDPKKMVELECALFIDVMDDGSMHCWGNGSAHMIGQLKDAGVEPKEPLVVTYLGKQKNKHNSYQSDRWDIRRLRKVVS